MSPEAVRVKDALVLICARAGVSPGDGSPEAGHLVRAWVLAHHLQPAAHERLHCPTHELLARLANVEHVCVTTDRVFLTRVKTDPLPGRSNGGAGHARESVALPAAVKAAVRLFDKPGGMERRKVA